MTIDTRLREFIVRNFYVTDPALLDDDASLIGEGVVDSTGLLEVIAFLESEFGVQVLDEETTPENLETIGRITTFVAHKLAGQPAGPVAPPQVARPGP